MPTSRSHGFGYVEAPRHDELPTGVPALGAEQANARQERKAGGRGIQKGATEVPAAGGRARKGRTKLTHDVPDALPVSDILRRRARFARKRMTGELARVVGGGACGMIASVLVKLAVEDIAMRETAMTEGNRDEARRLGESARMHLLYARETCAKDGEVLRKPGANGRLKPGWIEVKE
jgi:hypothetical protein